MSDAKISSARFVDWLRGFFDAIGDAALTPEQSKRIVEELEKVSTAAGGTVERIDLKKLFPQHPYPTDIWPGVVPITPTQPLPAPFPWDTQPSFPWDDPNKKIWYGTKTGTTATLEGATLLSPLQVDFNPNAACCAPPPTFKAWSGVMNFDIAAQQSLNLFPGGAHHATCAAPMALGPVWNFPANQGPSS